jgi:LuxR family transcriptional regulator, maltose regulon positive regulatory protein
VLGRPDDAAAHLAVAQAHAETAPPDRRRRLQLSIAAVRVSLARRRGHLSGVLEQVAVLASQLSGEPTRTSRWAVT